MTDFRLLGIALLDRAHDEDEHEEHDDDEEEHEPRPPAFVAEAKSGRRGTTHGFRPVGGR